jgi:hypothetical protein
MCSLTIECAHSVLDQATFEPAALFVCVQSVVRMCSLTIECVLAALFVCVQCLVKVRVRAVFS